MRLLAPMFALMLALAGCGNDVAPPSKPSENSKPAAPSTEKPKADLVPGVNVEAPNTTPPKASQTVAYTVEGMH